MGTIVQLCIGLIFVIYGIYSMFKGWRKQIREKSMIGLVCMAVGVFLSGYALWTVIYW